MAKLYCPNCGNVVSGKKTITIKSGALCESCSCGVMGSPAILNTLSLEDIRENKRYWYDHKELLREYSPTRSFLFEQKGFQKKEYTLDENLRKWCIDINGSDVLIGFDELISFELVVNDTVQQTGGLGTAVAGGLLFGAPGAIAGGIVGKKAEKKITHMSIRVVLDHPYFNEVYYPFISGGAVDAGSAFMTFIRRHASTVMSYLEYINSKKNTDILKSENTISIVDEIRKYKNLLDEGIITQDEFDRKKSQLLDL